MNLEIKVADKIIGPKHKPFIIGEMSGNHNQDIERALKLVDLAADAGCDALKIQTYTADSLTLNCSDGDFVISDEGSLWKGETLYSLYQKASTPYEWHKAIFDRCKERGMIGFSTPFDEAAVDFLEELGVPLYKIASFENIHLPLIKKVAKTGKPIIVSTGMASLSDLQDLVETARSHGCKDLILLKCTSSYPATPENTNILTIPHMRQLFDVQVGLSDHTMGVGVAVASVALGATVIEKHFTTSRAEGGVDSAFSLEPQELKALCVESERAWLGLGKVSYALEKSEVKSMRYRRSIYVSADICAGEVFSEKNVRIVRPGFGLSPKFFDQVLGRRASADFKKGTALKWEHLS